MARLTAIQRPWVRHTLIGVLAMAALLTALAWALTGPLGRAALSFAVNGRDVGGFGIVQIDGVEGDVLSDFSIREARISDSEGVWLSVHDVEIGWRSLSLLSGTIRIDRIEIASTEVARRPRRAVSQDGRDGQGGMPGIAVNQLTVNQIRLAQGVAGPAATYQVFGRLEQTAGGALTARADAARIDQTGDAARLTLERTRDGLLDADIAVTAPAEGPLATLLQLDEVGWRLEGQLRGSLEAGAGDYRLDAGDIPASAGRLEWDSGAWSLQASLRPDAWPGLPGQAADFTAGAELDGQGLVSPFTIEMIDLRTEALRVQAYDLHSNNWRADATLRGSGRALAQAYGVELEGAQARIERVSGQDRPAYDLALELTGLAQDQIGADQLSAQLQINETDQGYRVQTQGRIDGIAAAEPRVQALLGVAAQFDAQLAFNRLERTLAIEHVNASGAAWNAQAEGVWRTERAALDATARVEVTTLAPLGLGVAGPLSVEIATRNEGSGWNRLALEIASAQLTGPQTLNPLLGRLSGEAQLDLGPELITVPRLRVRTDAVALEAEARQAPGEGWRASGDVLFDLTALQAPQLEGQAAAAFDLDLSGEILSVRAQLETDEIAVGAMSINQPRMRAEAEISTGAASGLWRFDAAGDGRTVSAQGRFSLQQDQARLDLDAGQWGAVRLTGAAQRRGEALEAQLTAAGANPSRAWAADMRYRGALAAPYDGEVAGWLEAQRWPFADGEVSAARIELDGPLSQLPFTASARGWLIDPYMLSAEGDLRIVPGDLSLQSSLLGDWGERAIRATAPITLGYAAGRFDAAAEIELGEAEIALEVSRGQSTQLALHVAEAPPQLLTELTGLPPALGRWSVDTQLAQIDGVWRGDLLAQADSIRSATGPAEGALSGTGRLTLAETVRFELEADAGGLEIEAALSRPEAIENLGALLDPGWRGRVGVEGPLDTLARLYLPDEESFTGSISGSAEFQAGAAAGAVRISNGVFSSQAAGVRLSPFELAADFSGEQLHIREARLGDEAGGEATASGVIGFREEGLYGDGEVRFERFNAVTRPDLSVQATGDAQLSLEGQRLRVTGETDFERFALTPVLSRGPNIAQIEVEEINRPEALDPPYRRPIRIELDYTVRAEDSLFVSSRSFNSEWSADVRIEGPVNRLRLNGEANLRSGQVTLLTRIFDLEEGRISFAGPIDQTRVALLGRHRRADLEVTARAEGPITGPRVSLESDPSLPEDEVLARLLFNQDATALSPFQAAQIAAQLSGRNWLGGLSGAGQRLGLDRLNIGQGEDGGLTLLGGRRLGDDIYIELESGADALGAARIEWLITPNVVVLSQMTGDTDAEFAVRWRREFD